jgi:predicted adenine nucleotide alpha hydrolase (AANH) superfamily ATPase
LKDRHKFLRRGTVVSARKRINFTKQFFTKVNHGLRMPEKSKQKIKNRTFSCGFLFSALHNHSTRLSKDASQVAGYKAASCQVIVLNDQFCVCCVSICTSGVLLSML